MHDLRCGDASPILPFSLSSQEIVRMEEYMAQHHLFNELDFTRDNVLKLAEEAAKEPATNFEWDDEVKEYVAKETLNSVERVLRSMVKKHFGRNVSEYYRAGYCDMMVDELLDDIAGELFENREFETIGDLLQWYYDGRV